jgi:hypothetical protein
VVLSNRRQRYVLPKLVSGVPTDHLAFTRFSALAETAFPKEQTAARLKQFVVRAGGTPDQFGAPKPADDVLEAGLSLSQFFLPLVAEGRIAVKPWIREVAGRTVRFADGTEELFDAIVMGTGYSLDLPWLDDGVRQTLRADAHDLDLHAFTFHPDLPQFACMGLFHQVGPYFPVVELQARWIAYVWSGAVPAPTIDEQRAGVAASQARRPVHRPVVMHTTALLFARAAGAEPDPVRWPELARALYFGPLTPISFRLSGRDSLPDAPRRVLEDAAQFGAIVSPELMADERARLQSLAAARKDDTLAAFVRDLPAAAG